MPDKLASSKGKDEAAARVIEGDPVDEDINRDGSIIEEEYSQSKSFANSPAKSFAKNNSKKSLKYSNKFSPGAIRIDDGVSSTG